MRVRGNLGTARRPRRIRTLAAAVPLLSDAPLTSAFVPFVPPSLRTVIRPYGRLRGSTSEYLGSISAEEEEGANSTSSSRSGQRRTTRTTQQPFPKSSYPLSEDEDAHRYNFVSFIDYPMGIYTQVQRLVEPRSYARVDQFTEKNWHVPPSIDDVALPPSEYGPAARALSWNGVPARLVVGTAAYFAFPPVTRSLERAVEGVANDQIISLVGTFLPGISIVLGTLVSMTISMLYERQARMQETVSAEAAKLALVTRHLLDLFCRDRDSVVDSAQCIADQIRTLVKESRGREIMAIMYSDPYARILRLISEKEASGELDKFSPRVAEIRTNVADLFSLRARRLSDEALALPPTHFDFLAFLSTLLLIGFSLGTVATVHTDGMPAGIARVLFSSLTVVYVLCYEFAFDLNRPFYGVYQLRRSSAACHLLQIKAAFSDHPFIGDLVHFDILDDIEETPPEYEESTEQRKSSKRKTWYY